MVKNKYILHYVRKRKDGTIVKCKKRCKDKKELRDYLKKFKLNRTTEELVSIHTN